MKNETAVKEKSKGKWGVMTAIGLFLLTKFKYVLVLLKFAKFSTVISMFISLGFYALIYGWKFGVAIIYCIFIHEMGHLVAMKIKKIPASPAVFIPFVGAVIAVKGEIKDAKTEAFIAYGGPLAGLISLIPAIPLYMLTGDPLFALIVYLGAFLNLFNLMPVSPLDGGRITAAMSTNIWGLGLLGLLALNIFMPSPMMILLLIFGAITWFIRLGEGKRLILNNDKEAVSNDLLEDMRKSEQELVPSLLSLFEEKTFEDLKFFSDKFHSLNERKKSLSKPKEYSFSEKIGKRREIEKEEFERLSELHLLQYQMGLISSFSNTFDNGLEIEEQKEEFLEKVKELTNRKKKEINEELGEIQKESKKLKTYYATDTKTKIKWASLYLGLIVVLGYVFIESTQLMEVISVALR